MKPALLNLLVIASEARQSSGTVALDCRVALLLAMTMKGGSLMKLGRFNSLATLSEARQSSGTVALDCRVALLLAMTEKGGGL